MIRFENVDVTFGDHQAVRGLDLEVREGDFFTLLGPSGCGKTTALRTLAGFITPTSGRILIDGKDVTRTPSEARGIGMVFQNYALFPSMNVRENIAFGLSVKKVSKKEQRRLVDDIAERTGLTSAQLDKNVSELSGGQQQRVAIARALVLTPRILLLDEPLSNLDAKLRVQLREQLKNMQRDFGVTCVYVTHDQDEALTLSDRIAVLDGGRLQQIGAPDEIYDRSATSFVCRFIGESNALTPGMLAEINASSGADLVPDAESYIRPEKLVLSGEADGPVTAADPSHATLRGTIRTKTYHGAHSVYTVAAVDGEVRVSVPGSRSARFEPGDPAVLTMDPRWVLQYPGA
jgi:iron(III) transport system ATP-binding protein